VDGFLAKGWLSGGMDAALNYLRLDGWVHIGYFDGWKDEYVSLCGWINE
jgi:hypothetical protein